MDKARRNAGPSTLSAAAGSAPNENGRLKHEGSHVSDKNYGVAKVGHPASLFIPAVTRHGESRCSGWQIGFAMDFSLRTIAKTYSLTYGELSPFDLVLSQKAR
jgi:hypothetical protein